MALTDNLVGYWKMDESSGTRNDSHSNNLHLTDNNTVTSDTGKLTTAAVFTAANSESLSRADEAAIEISGDMTYAGWFYFTTLPADGATYDVAGRDPEDNANRVWCIRLARSGADYVARAYNSSDGTNGTTTGQRSVTIGSLSTSTWYHFAWVFSSGTFKFYKDGSFVNNGDFSLNSSMTTTKSAPLYIGARKTGQTGNFFDGRQDGVGLWSTALSASDISTLYNSGTGLDYPFSSGGSTLSTLMLMGMGA